MRIKQILAFPLDAAGVERRKSLDPPDLVAETTTIDYVPIADAGKLLMDSYYNFALFEPFIVQAGVKAEEEGYDAVAVDTVSDVGVSALRSRLSIPVMGGGQTGYAVASMLGRKFSVLTRWERWIWLHDASLDAFGLRDRCASVRAPRLPQEVVDKLPGLNAAEAAAIMEGHPDYFPAFHEEARRAIDEDGADVIVLASMTMRQAYSYLTERLEVPVIDPGPLTLKMLELAVSLNLSHSKRAFPSPAEVQDDRFLGLLGR